MMRISLPKDELVMLSQANMYNPATTDLGYYNPITEPTALISPKGIVVLGGTDETPMIMVSCPCGVVVRGIGRFHCTNCKRVFDTKVSFGEPVVTQRHSYDELYEAFLVSSSENGLGYSQTALNALVAAVTPETELYSGRALVKQKKRSWIGKFGYTDIVTAIAVVTFCILLHISHYF